jgi:hypothetical protein
MLIFEVAQRERYVICCFCHADSEIGLKTETYFEIDSRIPSISTGGAAMNSIIKTEVAVNKVGIIKTPNHPI